jgi:hypothetical protein
MDSLGKLLWKEYKDHKLYLAIWNMLSLFRTGTICCLKLELQKGSIAFAAIQEEG